VLLSRWTDRAKSALGSSVDAARGLGHALVGTEHLLVGLFPPGGIGATILTDAGATRAGCMARVVVLLSGLTP
jgi:ATP-dependent Clp protease ATP-binding subunit ClpC